MLCTRDTVGNFLVNFRSEFLRAETFKVLSSEWWAASKYRVTIILEKAAGFFVCLGLQAANCHETRAFFYQTTHRHIPEDNNIFKLSILYAEDIENIRDFICHPHIINKTRIRLCIPLEGQKAFGLNNDQMRGKIRCCKLGNLWKEGTGQWLNVSPTPWSLSRRAAVFLVQYAGGNSPSR